MENPLRHIYHLAVTIGPRGSATPQEEKAAHYTAIEMKSLGLEVERDSFPSITTFSWPYFFLYSLPALSLFLSLHYQPWLGTALALAGTLGFFLELNGREVIEPFLPKKRSYNVLGRLPPRGIGRRRVVLVAHHDTSKAALNFSPAMVKNFRTSFLLMTGSMAAVPVFLALHSLTHQSPWLSLALIPVLYLLLSALFLLHRELWSRYTPGANDNASGVAVMLSLGAKAAAEGLSNTELYLLSTGSEEAGTFGIRHFIQTKGEEFQDAYFLNLDNVGAGQVQFMVREGMFPSFPADENLVEHCREVAAANPELGVKEGCYALMPTDTTRLLVNGYKAISLLAVDDRGLLPNWHWITDTYDRIDPQTIHTCRDFVWLLLKRLDIT